MQGRSTVLRAIVGLVVGACLRFAKAGGPLNVLFVGNSFTYAGNTDQVFKQLLSAAGWESNVRRYAEPNYNFARHVSDAYDKGKDLYSLLGPGGKDKYHYVVFQDESHEPGLGGEAYRNAQNNLDLLVKLAKERGATPVLFLTWGYAGGDTWEHPDIYPDYLAMQARLSAGYLSLASAVRQAENTNTFIAPVGLAFQKIYTLNSAAAALAPTGTWERWDPTSSSWQAAPGFGNHSFGSGAYPSMPGAADAGSGTFSSAPLPQTSSGVVLGSVPSARAGAPGPGPEPWDKTGQSPEDLAMPAHGSPTAAMSFAATLAENGIAEPAVPATSTGAPLMPQTPVSAVEAVLGSLQVGAPFERIAGAFSGLASQLHLAPDAIGSGTTATSQLASVPHRTPGAAVQSQQSQPVGTAAVRGASAPGLAPQMSDSWPKSDKILDTAGDYKGEPGAAVGSIETADLGLPSGSGTFNQLYKSDAQHPSSLGTYLAACTLAASISGMRMTGNQYGTNVVGSQWAYFLQQTADSIVFEGGTPKNFPPYPWAA